MQKKNLELANEGKDLTPERAKSLIVRLYAGKGPTHRDVIAQEVLKFHGKSGGNEPDIAKYGAKSHESFENWIGNKALGPLQVKGLASGGIENGLYVWRIYSSPDETDADPTHQRRNTALSQYDALEAVGSGNQAVYAYYFETYRHYAELKNDSRWPIKIGKSEERDFRRRIRVQTQSKSTGMPEFPTVCLVWYIDDASRGESLLHMSLGDRRKIDAPGAEWYHTNPNELKTAIEEIEETISLSI